ncbi:MAG: sugar transporter [Syntrophus sp. (in: bacteria)]|nr:sugar transporter [Syntrophus sp. (in: bacteria)]
MLLLCLAVSPLKAAQDTPGPDISEKPVLAAVKTGTDYLIGPGDLLDISVWRDETLTKTVAVLPDGKISFPLVGQLVAAGKTIAQIKQEIEEKLTPYIPEPVLSVEVKQVNSMEVYVIGRVNFTGQNRFMLNKYVNVLQALSMAGGLNPFAKRNSIKIFRQEGGKTKVFDFRYDEVANGIRLEQNIQLKPGDVVMVP